MDNLGPYRIVTYDAVRHGDGAWRVVSAVFQEYAFELSNGEYDHDLLDPPSKFGAAGFAVAEDAAGRVVGCVGVTDEGGGLFELRRLYVLAEARRAGLGRALTLWAMAEAAARGGREFVLFSDIAFVDAHRLYERLGFRRHRFRYAPDPWQSREWGFLRELA